MVVEVVVSQEHVLASGVVVMQLLVEERVLDTFQRREQQVGEHCVASAVVDHHKSHLEIQTNNVYTLIIF